MGCPELLRLVEVKDVAAEELIVAGKIADTPYGEQLKNLKVNISRGVKEAIAEAKHRLANPVTVEPEVTG